MPRLPRRSRGFTLIELMIVVAIVGILSTVALPSFEGALQKARRAELVVAALMVQTAQERFRSNNTVYGDSLTALGVPAATTGRHYTLEIATSDANGFALLATARGLQTRDTACRHMSLASTGIDVVYRSGPDATLANPAAANRRCWSL